MRLVHFGLVIGIEGAGNARLNRNLPPVSGGWGLLSAWQSDSVLRADALSDLLVNALTARLDDDNITRNTAIAALTNSATLMPDTATDSLQAMQRIFGFMQAVECVREGLDAAQMASIASTLSEVVADLNRQLPQMNTAEAAWLILVNLCAGIVLESTSLIESAEASFRAIIADVHPSGYLDTLVAGEDRGTLERTLDAVQALTLAAEVAGQQGLAWWKIDVRGVSVMTAALYPLYYYYYPEKWPWFGGLTLELAQPVFAQRSGFVELIAHQQQRPIHAVQLLLDELRPIGQLFAGGPLTLTHAAPVTKRRGLFGR
jgi:hypothetical protein